jgi:hypothetical protein
MKRVFTTICIYSFHLTGTAVLALFLVAKLTINVSFMIIYPYAGELYPTEVRALGFALGSYIGFLGTIPIPFIVHLVST